ncbi:MAG: hypothetical protein IAE78_27900 [Myxococcus sp.]|nr:hypothetical protein [Myxococcus sp.]
MGLKVDGGVSSQSNNEVLECREPPRNSTTSNQSSAIQNLNSVSTVKGQGPLAAPPPGPDCEAGPSVRASELQAQVELCKRAADLPVVGPLGATHHWLRTPNKEVGMGQNPGQIPGHGEAPPVMQSTQWIDHSKEKEKECVVVPDVDAACVERETEIGKDTGQWVPFVNDCHTKTQEVLDKCSTKPKPEPVPGPDFGDPSKTGAGYSL